MNWKQANSKAAEALTDFEFAAQDDELPDEEVWELYEKYFAAEAVVKALLN